MQCKHPLGFTVLRMEQMCCFDCGTPTPGRCVCGALYKTPRCQGNGHLQGAELDLKSALETPVENYEGLRAGDKITAWYGANKLSVAVVSTCVYGALIEYPWSKVGDDGIRTGRGYVTRQTEGVWQ